jgi:hypothetical protein
VGVYATVQTIVHIHHSNIYQHGLELVWGRGGVCNCTNHCAHAPFKYISACLELFEWSVLCMLIFVVDILFSAFDV